MKRKQALGLITVIALCGLFIFGNFNPNLFPSPPIEDEGIDTLWSYATGGEVKSSPAIADLDSDGFPEVVVGSDDNQIYSFNGEDGSLLWSYPTGDNVRSSPVIADLDADGSSEVIVGSDDGTLYALNGIDGTRYWIPASQSQEHDGNLGFDGAQARYSITIDEGAESLRCILTCGSNDYDLYIRYDSEPTTDDYDYRGYSGSGEDITVPYPQAGIWYIMVDSFSGSGPYHLSIYVNYEGVLVEDTTEFEGSLDAPGDLDRYTINIPSGTTDVHCILSSTPNDFDLYGKLESEPTTSDYDWRGYASGSEDFHITDIEPGLWHIMVYSYSGSGSYSLTITLTTGGTSDTSFDGPITLAPTVADLNDDTLLDVIASASTEVRALEGMEGTTLWSYYAGSTVTSCVAVGDLNNDDNPDVIFGDATGIIYALNGASGNLLWTVNTGAKIEATPVIVNIDDDSNPEIIVGNSVGNIYALDGFSGEIEWTLLTGNSITSSPALGDIDSDERLEIVIGTNNENGGHLFAINSEDAQVIWTVSILEGIGTAPTLMDITGNGALDVIFGTDGGSVIGLAGDTQIEVLSVDAPDSIESSLAVMDVNSDGRLNVVFGCDNNLIYALDLEDPGQRIFWMGHGGASDFTGTNSIEFIDADNDMLSIYSESVFRSNPRSNDSDSDLIQDGLDVALGFSPTLSDSDFDTLDDYSEYYIHHTNGAEPDTDFDLLSDGLEINVYFTSPRNNDSDFDSLSDGLEILVYGSDPHNIDSDNDTILDGVEVLQYGSSPALVDTDFDSITDFDEIFVYGTNPNMTDSDQDGLWDYFEITEYLTDPLVADSDGDSALDGAEILEMETDPLVFDSDGDSYSDGWEFSAGFDPLDPAVPLAEILIFYLPIIGPALFIFGLVVVIIRIKRKPDEQEPIEPYARVDPEPVIPEPVTKYDLMDDVDKPWLYDGKTSLLRTGDAHDFMQWLVSEEKLVGELVRSQQFDDALERLRKLLQYVTSERDMLARRSLRTYENTEERLLNKITELEER